MTLEEIFFGEARPASAQPRMRAFSANVSSPLRTRSMTKHPRHGASPSVERQALRRASRRVTHPGHSTIRTRGRAVRSLRSRPTDRPRPQTAPTGPMPRSTRDSTGSCTAGRDPSVRLNRECAARARHAVRRPPTHCASRSSVAAATTSPRPQSSCRPAYFAIFRG